MRFVPFCLLVFACTPKPADTGAGDTDTDSDTDSDTDTDSDADTDTKNDLDSGDSAPDSAPDTGPCFNTVTPWPAAGATDVYDRTTVEAKFQTEESTATLTVTDPTGDTVAGTTAWRESTLVFTPAASFASSTKYTADAHYSCGDASWSFTTSTTGAAIVASTVVGNAYAVDIRTGRVVEPAGVGDLLSEYLTTPFLLGVVSEDGTTLQLIGATGQASVTPAVEDPCVRTVDFDDADFTADPYFQYGPRDTVLPFSTGDVTYDDLVVAGSFSPDGSEIDGMVLSGSIDTRPLVPLLDPTSTDPGAVCNLAASIGVACVDCRDGQPYCMAVTVDSIVAPKLTSGITPESDPCAASACSASPACAGGDTGP